MVPIDNSDHNEAQRELIPATLGEWNGIIRRARIGGDRKAACFVFSSYANADGTSIYCGVARLAVGAECSYRTAQRHLKWIRDEGLTQLVKAGNRNGYADEYRLTLYAGIVDRPWHLDPDEERSLVGTVQEENRGKVRAHRARAAAPEPCNAILGGVTSGDVTPNRQGCNATKDGVPPSMAPTLPDSLTSHEAAGVRTGLAVPRARAPEDEGISVVEVIGEMFASTPDGVRRPAPTGLGFCVVCYGNGKTVLAMSDDGSYCGMHSAR